MFDVKEIEKQIYDSGYAEIKITSGSITIEGRPHYCDRGRYIVKVFSDDVRKLFIDEADGFPRYYFGIGAMVSEIEAWMKARGQNERQM